MNPLNPSFWDDAAYFAKNTASGLWQNFHGKASPSTYDAIVDARAKDEMRGSGGRLSDAQARAIAEPEVRRMQAQANADADKNAVFFGSNDHALLFGAIGLGLLALLLRSGGRRR
jgi:hypothetical protein